MLSQDISVMTDGGNISIVAEYLTGIDNTIKLITYVYKEYQSKAIVKIGSVNHHPALLFYQDNILTNCQVFAIDPQSETISNIYSIVDPDKLKNFTIILS